MTPDRKKPGVAFWATVVVVCLPILYVASFGPWCWFVVQKAETQDKSTKPSLYRPLIYAWWYGSGDIRSPIAWYANLASRTQLCAHKDADGALWLVSIAP
jgi:hypothetical protein